VSDLKLVEIVTQPTSADNTVGYLIPELNELNQLLVTRWQWVWEMGLPARGGSGEVAKPTDK
jgi:hypothetical protein